MQFFDGLLHLLKQRSPGPAGPSPAPQSENEGQKKQREINAIREKTEQNNPLNYTSNKNLFDLNIFKHQNLK